ncbi:hypothetical protein [Streptomyces sp. NPDC060333]|uniref:hypothetical protein n=1 Tax=Streptomyces sp. NPDC060333 TaxID=3347098 RepID=UPI00366065BE
MAAGSKATRPPLLSSTFRDLGRCFRNGLFAGAHVLGFTVAGESVPGSLVGSSAAIVNGICFIIGGVLQAVPGLLPPDAPDLADYGHALLMMPILLLLGAIAGFFIKDTATAPHP